MKITHKLKNLVILISIFSLALMTFSTSTVHAATMQTGRKVAISDPRPSATNVTYTFTFKLATGSTTGITGVRIQFCANAGVATVDTCTAIGGTGFAYSNSSPTISGFGTASTIGTPSLSGDTLSVPVTNVGSETAATDHVLGLKNFTNPSTTQIIYARIRTYTGGSYTTPADDGTVALAIIGGVAVTGTQQETLTVTMGTVSSAAAIGNGQTADVTSVAGATPSVSFVLKAAQASSNAAHTMLVVTNGAGGYTLTLVENQVMTSGGNTIPDFGGGSTGTDAGSLWSEATSLGFGVNSKGAETSTTTFGASTGSGDTLYKKLTAGTPVTVASTAGVTSGNTTTINYRVAVSTTQQPGTYTNTLTYVCTPTY